MCALSSTFVLFKRRSCAFRNVREMANLEATAGAEDGAEDGPNEEFFQRFGSSIQDDLGADEDPTKSDCLSSLSALERAAHEVGN